MPELTIEKIMQRLPHRYPFLLIDKVLDFEQGKTIRALKNVTVNEPQFTGHFPGHSMDGNIFIFFKLPHTNSSDFKFQDV